MEDARCALELYKRSMESWEEELRERRKAHKQPPSSSAYGQQNRKQKVSSRMLEGRLSTVGESVSHVSREESRKRSREQEHEEEAAVATSATVVLKVSPGRKKARKVP